MQNELFIKYLFTEVSTEFLVTANGNHGDTCHGYEDVSYGGYLYPSPCMTVSMAMLFQNATRYSVSVKESLVLYNARASPDEVDDRFQFVPICSMFLSGSYSQAWLAKDQRAAPDR